MSDQQQYSIVTIDPSEVDIGPDAPFRVRRYLPGEPGESDADRRLTESIQLHGILQPPLFVTGLDPSRKSPLLVHGYRRIAAARSAGLGNVNALLMKVKQHHFGYIVSLWLEEILFSEQLSELEKILLADRAFKLFIDTPIVWLEKAFGKKLSEKYILRLLKILSLGEPVLEALHRGDISTGDLLLLMEHPFVDTNEAAGIAAGERLTRSEQKKVVHLMLRIGDGGEEEWKKFTDSYEPGSGALLDTLNRTIHPTLTGDFARIEAIVRDMHLPPGTSINPPENMEGVSYRLRMNIRNEQAFEQTLDRLRDALESGIVSELLKILRGEN